MNDPLLVAIADAHGTPCYVYDLDAITRRAARLHASLPDAVLVAYAVKANPLPAILERLAGLGIGFDVASGGELEACLAAGAAPSAICFTGPGKRDDELRAAVEARIGAITVESLTELRRLESIASGAGRAVEVLLRAGGRPQGREQVIGTGSGKFGMRTADLLEAARLAAASPSLRLAGLHRFDASNVTDAAVLAAHAADLVTLAGRVAEAAGRALRLVDAGGGLGVPYADDDGELDLASLGRGLASALTRMRGDPWLADATLLIEPGRYLVGPAGVYLTRVVDVKAADDGALVAVCDGGIHHLLRPALVGVPHRIRAIGDRDRRSVEVRVAGPLCTGLDVLHPSVPLPPPRAGDLLAVLDAGAYGFSESMPFFLSHPTPAEVVVIDGTPHLARAPLRPWTLGLAPTSGAPASRSTVQSRP